jgi:hypothetical protein
MNARFPLLAALAALALGLGLSISPCAEEKKGPARAELLETALAQLVKIQDKDGAWPYEGVYRVEGDIPVGYRVGGTAAVAGALLAAAPDNKEARAATERGLAYVLKNLDDPKMKPSTRDAYDVRVWGHACALEFLCQVRAARAAGEHAKAIDAWVPKLIETLVTEEIEGGGWNYAGRQRQASFVTAPVVQALLWAKAQGETVPDEVLKRARKVLEASRTEEGAFVYSGSNSTAGRSKSSSAAGSAARSAACETTLLLIGGGSREAVKSALDAFHKHWDELHKRHQKTGTHEGPHLIAPYYFYYGHRYAAQAIEVLPREMQAAERDRLLEVILRTREKDGTWNDRVFARSRAYGTAMIVLALMGDRAPMPPRLEKK